MRRSLFLATVTSLMVIGSAYAQATRTWVSGVGDDANPCSRTAPCKTFAGAISKTASGGIIDALDPGGFGAVTITKPITIEGVGTLASVLVSLTNAIIINIVGSPGTHRDVVLRNLLINGVGNGINGIRFLAGDSLTVEDCSIQGFTGGGIDFEPNTTAHLGVRGTSVLFCGTSAGGAGIFIKPAVGGSAKASIETSQMRRNQAGLRAEDNSSVTVFNSIASSNVNNGFLALSNAAAVDMNIEHSESSQNGTNGVATSGANAFLRISNCVITGNVTGINQISGHLFSFQNNRIIANGFDGTPAPNLLSSP
jgi:hypothetical protein